MSGFLYLIPNGHRNVTLAELQAAGLGHAFERKPVVAEVLRGPAGSGGIVMADDARVPMHQIGYYPDRQTWRKVPGSSVGAWIGWFTSERPGPTDLTRSGSLPGSQILLGDGNAWTIPTAIQWLKEGEAIVGWAWSVPCAVTVDEAGHWTTGGPALRYARLCEIADAYRGALSKATEGQAPAAGTIRFDFAGALDAAVEVLGNNYHVSKTEAVAIELLTNDSATRILNAAISLDVFLEWLRNRRAGAAEAGG